MDHLEIIEIFWDSLEPGETAEQSLVTEKRWEEIYQHGLVDSRRVPKTRWMDILRQFPEEEGFFLIKLEDVSKIQRLLYQGEIKKPFDPYRLKDGMRPPEWLQEMYQKVLKFETELKIQEWNKIIQTEIKPRFFMEDTYRFDRNFKDFILNLIEKNASPLRKLEIWVHLGPPEEMAPKPSKATTGTSSSPVIEDKFEIDPASSRKIRSIEKLYYEGEKGKTVDDAETLSFLDQLEEMEEDEDSELP